MLICRRCLRRAGSRESYPEARSAGAPKLLGFQRDELSENLSERHVPPPRFALEWCKIVAISFEHRAPDGHASDSGTR
jgi:hypothetical protein